MGTRQITLSTICLRPLQSSVFYRQQYTSLHDPEGKRPPHGKMSNTVGIRLPSRTASPTGLGRPDLLQSHNIKLHTGALALSASRTHAALVCTVARYADPRNMRLVDRILQPSEVINTVNEVSPLQVSGRG